LTQQPDRRGRHGISPCWNTGNYVNLRLVMLGRFPWSTVSGGSLLDDPGSRSTVAVSAKAFAHTATQLRQLLNSCARILK
jgi:hypothetical protein